MSDGLATHPSSYAEWAFCDRHGRYHWIVPVEFDEPDNSPTE